MKYAYYPGCSLTESAHEYDVSTRAVLARLGAEVAEIEDWTCCGASAVENVSRLLTYALPARNIALAMNMADAVPGGLDILAPCSACYLNLKRVVESVPHDRTLADEMAQILAVEDLALNGEGRALPRVRHLLDVLANDFTTEDMAEAVERPLEGLSIAPYYGCQALRPYVEFDDPEHPVTMEPILRALGAEVHDWDVGAKCCGASLMATKKYAAVDAVARILAAAQGADAVVTVCPMCQLNLEAYQTEALRKAGLTEKVTVLYLPQLMGLAMGLGDDEVLLGKNMVVTDVFKRKLRDPAPVSA